MSDRTLINVIRKVNLPKLIFPILLIIALVLTTLLGPMKSFIIREKINFPDQISSAFHDNKKFVTVNLNDLYYTGINYTNKHKVKGCYYYCLYNDNCYYILISTKTLGLTSNTDSPPAHIDNFKHSVLLKQNQEEIGQLTELMSRQLNWTSKALNMITSKIIMDEHHISIGREYHLLTIMIIILLSSIIHIIIVIRILINPARSRTVKRLIKLNKTSDIFSIAKAEYEDFKMIAPGIMLTSNFYIAYDNQNIFIVPLENIVWAYKYSYLNHFSLHKKISYSLCIVTDQKKRYTVHNKPKDGVDLVLNQLQTRFPEIMIGYKNENKHG